MLSRCARVWFLIFDQPRCAICHGYSQPAKVFCSEDCKLKLEALGLPTGEVQGSFSRLFSQPARRYNATSSADHDGAFATSSATPHTKGPRTMLTIARLLSSACALALLPAVGFCQFYKIHDADLAAGGTGQFTTSITSQNNVTHQATTDSVGFLGSFREHPLAWAGVEVNYGYTPFTERFTNNSYVLLANVPVSMHEFTAAYMFHPHFRRLQPFVNAGGGALYFHPYPVPVTTQWRGTGLFEIGADIPTKNPHMGFRVQARSLLYRAPNFKNANIASSRWVATNEPSAGVYIRF